MKAGNRSTGCGRSQPDWYVHAACRRNPLAADDYFPENKSDPTAATRRAKAVCAPCPVRDLCLELGDAISPKWGTWGGLTAAERAARRQWIEGRSQAA